MRGRREGGGATSVGNIHVLCFCDCVENMCLKMHLIVTVNHGPSCLLRLMAEGEASEANRGQAIYRTNRHSKANKMFIIMAFFP